MLCEFIVFLPPSPRRWAKPLCQGTPLVGQDLQPAKKDKIQMRSELRQQLSSCLLDLVVVHIFFSLLNKYMVNLRPILANCYIHTSTSAGLVLVLLLVKLARSSQSSHSSPWVEKEMSTICVFHLNRPIAKDASQDGCGKESEDAQQ